MEQQIKVFRVFIASPSDLGDERRALREEVEEINGIFSRETDWRIELLGWEDTLPGAGRPQELINADLDKADLFIGCLWRRWGTPTGSNGRTGFEEEFERALDRRMKTGGPEMWLFFKDVDSAEREDPGEQLKRVLAFRAQEQSAKRLLFHEFPDTTTWRQKVSTLLLRHLLRLLRAMGEQRDLQAAGPRQTAQPAVAKATSTSPPQHDVARTAIATILIKAGEELQSKRVVDFRESLDEARCARLLIFAASLYSDKLQPIEFGIHEVNSTFWYRKHLTLTAQERLFLLKTVVADTTLAKPGWYWGARWKVKLTKWLPWLITHDRDEVIRALAIDFARNIGFSLRRNSATGSVISRAIADPSPTVQLAALQYLVVAGRRSDLTILNRLARDKNSTVNARAIKSQSLLRLRLTPDKELRRILLDLHALDHETIESITKNLSDVTLETLRSCLTSPAVEVRAAAAAELRRRKALSLQAALQLCTDQARLVRAQGFLELIDRRAAPKPSEIRAELHTGFSLSTMFETHPADADEVIRHYFDYSTQDELWNYINTVDENSSLALRALGARFFDANRSLIRDALLDDFGAQVGAAKEGQRADPLWNPISYSVFDPIENRRKELRTAALEILSDHADIHDRQLFRRFLTADVSVIGQTIACLRGLASVGESQDCASIKGLFAVNSSVIKAAAARALLALTSDKRDALRDLVAERSHSVIWVAVAACLRERINGDWDTFKPLLTDENDDIRRLVCHFAIATLKKREILAVLTDYVKQRYYYNVVVLFDRALYAPPNVRKHLDQLEMSHFRKLSQEATRNWAGLTL